MSKVHKEQRPKGTPKVFEKRMDGQFGEDLLVLCGRQAVYQVAIHDAYRK